MVSVLPRGSSSDFTDPSFSAGGGGSLVSVAAVVMVSLVSVVCMDGMVCWGGTA